MDRTDFYNIVTVNGNREYDYLNNSLANFKMNYPVAYYRTVQEDVGRPDLISYKQYGTVEYWWLVCYVNGVKNTFVDIKVGELYKIPSVLDIYAFYKQFSISNTGSSS